MHNTAQNQTTTNNANPLEAATLKPKGGDPWFGLSRSYWYDLERRGIIRLTRLTLPGNRKPRVLLRRDEAFRAFAKLSRNNEATIKGASVV
jgi:hypothetical protein